MWDSLEKSYIQISPGYFSCILTSHIWTRLHSLFLIFCTGYLDVALELVWFYGEKLVLSRPCCDISSPNLTSQIWDSLEKSYIQIWMCDSCLRYKSQIWNWLHSPLVNSCIEHAGLAFQACMILQRQLASRPCCEISSSIPHLTSYIGLVCTIRAWVTSPQIWFWEPKSKMREPKSLRISAQAFAWAFLAHVFDVKFNGESCVLS